MILLALLCSDCYYFGDRGIAPVVCSIILSKGSGPFMRDPATVVIRPVFSVLFKR